MHSFVDIEENIRIELSPMYMRITKTPPSLMLAFVFIGGAVFFMIVIMFLLKNNPGFLIPIIGYSIVVVLAFLRKVVSVNLIQETIQTSYYIWKYKIITNQPLSYHHKEFYIVGYADDENGISYALELEGKKVIGISTFDGVKKFLKIAANRIKASAPGIIIP